MIDWNELYTSKKLAVAQCDIKTLQDQLFALGKVLEAQSDELAKLREEVRTRYRVLDKDMTETEQRLMTRLEDLEDRMSEKPENDILPTESNPERGLVRWSERKRALQRNETNPERWKPVPKEVPKEEKNGDIPRT